MRGTRGESGSTAPEGRSPFSGLTPRLDPYAGESALARARSVLDPAGERAGTAGGLDPEREERPEGLSVVILTLDRPDLVIPLVRDLVEEVAPGFRSAGRGFEVVLGDTGSSDPELLAFYEDPPAGVEVLRGLRYHFGACNNRLFGERTRYDTVLFLNNDVEIGPDPEALERMYRLLRRSPGTGIAGLLLELPDGGVQHAGIDFFRSGELRGLCHHPLVRRPRARVPEFGSRPAPAVTGACMMVRARLFARLRGFDEAYAVECQDVDLCLRARRIGVSTRLVDAEGVVHRENETRPAGEEHWPDRRRLVRKWAAFVERTFPEPLFGEARR